MSHFNIKIGGYGKAIINKEKGVVTKMIKMYGKTSANSKKDVIRANMFELIFASNVESKYIPRVKSIAVSADRLRAEITSEYCGEVISCLDIKTMKPEDRRSVFIQALKILRWLRRNGIVHADISCQNLCYNTNKQLKLIDFGMSVFKDNGLGMDCGEVAGSALYTDRSFIEFSPPLYKGDMYAMAASLSCAGITSHAMEERLCNTSVSFNERTAFYVDAMKESGWEEDILKKMLLPIEERISLKDLLEKHVLSSARLDYVDDDTIGVDPKYNPNVHSYYTRHTPEVKDCSEKEIDTIQNIINDSLHGVSICTRDVASLLTYIIASKEENVESTFNNVDTLVMDAMEMLIGMNFKIPGLVAKK